jgi:hypothetical protein
LIRRLLPYTTVLTVLAALYVAWVLYSRRESVAEAERQAKEKQAEMDQKLVSAFGGDQLTILGFNSAEHQVASGGRVLLCYGVSNAVKVSIEPGVEPVKPALSHCLEVHPQKTTTYTLQAEDAQGHSKNATLTVKVR